MREYFVFLKKIACAFKKIARFEPNSVGGILGERHFVYLERKVACDLKKKTLSVLNQKVWEAF